MYLSYMSHTMASNITAEQLKVILDEKLDQKLTPLNLKVSELGSKLEDAMRFLELANAQYEEVMAKFKVHDEERMKLQEENKILKSALHVAEGQLCQIQNTLNDLEQYSRRECLEIQGIPASEDSVNESTNDIVCKIGKLMGVEIAPEDISVSHRLPINKRYKGKRSTQAIIVKFVRRDVKEAVFRSRNKLKNKSTHDIGYRVSSFIYINESLTEKNKDLLRYCLKAKNELNYKFLWTSNGRIFLRRDEGSTSIHIKNKEELSKLSS